MNVQRLTKKSLEAVEQAQSFSRELENMQIEQIHLLWALLQEPETPASHQELPPGAYWRCIRPER